jgi:GNAT superfamily N-acetyltransferase
MDEEPRVLPGQDTLVANWEALAVRSRHARVETTASWVIAVFPEWEPLNNAIALGAPERASFGDALAALHSTYADRGVAPGAMWIPAATTSFDDADRVKVEGLVRDTTTLVMHTALDSRFALDDDVHPTSVACAALAGDAPVPEHDLDAEDGVPGLRAWVLVQDGLAVAGLWSMVHGSDCGIYGVGTVPARRRQGIARALVGHALADATRRGARTATLQSTPMGQPLYEALGFVAAGRYEEWVWP